MSRLCVSSRFSDGGVEESIGAVLADRGGEGDVVGGVDGQVEGDDGVASGGVLCPNGVIMDVRRGRIGCLVGEAVFVVGASCADGFGERDGVHGKDGQN